METAKAQRTFGVTLALQIAFISSIGCDVLLLGLGVAVHPAALNEGLFLALFIQAIYAMSVWWGLKGTPDATETRFGLLFGLLIASIFVSEIVLELLVTIDNNTPLANVEFGTVFVLLFLAGFSASWRSGSTRSAITAAIWAALLGSLIWYAAVLSTYYLGHNSSRQQQSFQAEGTFDDFRQSGMTDFDAFVLQDLWGAGFFHLLVAPLFALILGGAGAIVGHLGKQMRLAISTDRPRS